MRPALFESQDSAGRFVSNAEESKSHGRKWLTSAVCVVIYGYLGRRRRG